MSKRIPYIGALLILIAMCSVLLTGCSKSLNLNQHQEQNL